MENIKKVILSFNEDRTIRKLVVVSDNSIERYTSETISEEELMNIYLDCVNELENEYSEKLTGLTRKERLNKLNELKLIERNEEDLITNITETDDSLKFIVNFENDQKEFESYDESEYKDNLKKMIQLMCNTYGIKEDSYSQLISKLEKLGLYSQYEEKKSLPVVMKENKISNLSVRKKWILGILGTGVIAAIVYGGIELLKNNHNDDNNNKKTIEIPAVETPTPTPYVDNVVEEENIVLDPTVEPTVYIPTPTPFVIENSKQIYFEDEQRLFPNYNEPVGNNLLMMDTIGKNYYGINHSLDDVIEIRNHNMDSLENNIQSNIPVEDEGYFIYFENLFNNSDICDKAFVKYFSMFGNQIIKCGYVDKNFDYNMGINNYSKKACYEAIRCIRDNQPISVYINGEKQNIYYDNLSNKAKNVVLNIAWSNYTILNSSPDLYKLSDSGEEANISEIHYNDEVLTKSDIADILINAYEELSIVK